MPVGEIAGELLGGLFRLIVYIFAEILFEVFIKGTGYRVCRIFKKGVDPEGMTVVIVGLFFWVLVILSVVALL